MSSTQGDSGRGGVCESGCIRLSPNFLARKSELLLSLESVSIIRGKKEVVIICNTMQRRERRANWRCGGQRTSGVEDIQKGRGRAATRQAPVRTIFYKQKTNNWIRHI